MDDHDVGQRTRTTLVARLANPASRTTELRRPALRLSPHPNRRPWLTAGIVLGSAAALASATNTTVIPCTSLHIGVNTDGSDLRRRSRHDMGHNDNPALLPELADALFRPPGSVLLAENKTRSTLRAIALPTNDGTPGAPAPTARRSGGVFDTAATSPDRRTRRRL